MSTATLEESFGIGRNPQRKYKGVRRRRWGKWVSEIRVPGTQERLWLGSYSTPEGAAIAHDIAFYCLRRPSSLNGLNFPSMLPSNVSANMSPKSIQKSASDAGMAVDAQMMLSRPINNETKENENSVMMGMETDSWEKDSCNGSWEASLGKEGEALSISVEDYL
ncbi:ethylene-responsive transcription factor ERF020-like [Durio zibethinus]|uniref:Ethylene-responsive transcription factor ERF020-like n=1 Tax=Durio zibethinus TaxID=66656 RepID=A0A6P5Y2V3_DURZI|nr:ethylene-responsive transcription factor ERF020-like [Durio zibethinus]